MVFHVGQIVHVTREGNYFRCRDQVRDLINFLFRSQLFSWFFQIFYLDQSKDTNTSEVGAGVGSLEPNLLPVVSIPRTVQGGWGQLSVDGPQHGQVQRLLEMILLCKILIKGCVQKKKIAEKETLVHMGGRGVKIIPFF